MGEAQLESWVGRKQTDDDVAEIAPLAGLWRSGELPLLARWLYFLPPHQRHSLLDRDGHPRRAVFLPPVPLPRRMWAGSRIVFHHPLLTLIRKRLRIDGAHRRPGETVFVTVKHEIIFGSLMAIEEEQDIVYREAATSPTPAASAAPALAKLSDRRESEVTRQYAPDPTGLFRYLALIFTHIESTRIVTMRAMSKAFRASWYMAGWWRRCSWTILCVHLVPLPLANSAFALNARCSIQHPLTYACESVIRTATYEPKPQAGRWLSPQR